jgi:hypothetical protein
MVCKNHKVHIYKELLVNRLQKSSCNFPAVAKLQCMEKTMILDQFTSRAAAESPAPEHILG